MKAHSVLHPAGSDAETIAQLWWWFLGVSTAVYLLVITALVMALWRARRRNSDNAELTRADRRRLAVGAAMSLTVVILLGMLAGDFVLGRGVLNEHHPAGDPVRIRITAQQFWWQVEYPADVPSDQVLTANELVVPVGRPVELELRSRDVIHSFWLPALAGKKDLIPGVVNTLRFSVNRPGTYEGQCAEFCGYQHANMRTVLTAVSAAEFEAWKQTQRLPGRQPTTPQQQRGQQVFVEGSCALCHAVQGTAASASNGPDLTHFASRLHIAAGPFPNTSAYLAAWISNPQKMKPGTNMPNGDLRPADLEAVTAYLRSLQ